MNTEISEQRALLQNSFTTPITVAIEPWGETWNVEPGDSLELLGTGPSKEAKFEFDINLPTVAVYAWSGSTIKVFYNGEHRKSGSEGFPAK